jgi:hypothetical protein
MGDLQLTEITPTGMTTFGGIGSSGTITLSSLTATRAAGSFAAQVSRFSDGGVEPLAGTFDVAI